MLHIPSCLTRELLTFASNPTVLAIRTDLTAVYSILRMLFLVYDGITFGGGGLGHK